ncbi:hypothetical protein B0T21DRAFT_267717, partial [Apiosordaria backusii]
MDEYRCPPQELPLHLYRVQYRNTRTVYNKSSGLEARDTTTLYNKSGFDDDFIQAVQNQFTWGHKGRTPFISFFSDEEHATKWGYSLKGWGRSSSNDDWTLLTIDTSCLQNVYVFKLSTLIDRMGVQIPKKAMDSHKPGGYICLHRIPACAISSVRTGSDI